MISVWSMSVRFLSYASGYLPEPLQGVFDAGDEIDAARPGIEALIGSLTPKKRLDAFRRCDRISLGGRDSAY